MKQWKGKLINIDGWQVVGNMDLDYMLAVALYGKSILTYAEEAVLREAEWKVTIGSGSVVISRIDEQIIDNGELGVIKVGRE